MTTAKTALQEKPLLFVKLCVLTQEESMTLAQSKTVKGINNVRTAEAVMPRLFCVTYNIFNSNVKNTFIF